MEGEGKLNNMKAAGIIDWQKAVLKTGAVREDEIGELIEENEAKQERLKNFALPTVTAWGPRASFEELTQLIPEDKRTSATEKFLIRCSPKDQRGQLKLKRQFGLNWSETVAFADDLVGGKENYNIEIRHDPVPEYSGTIIADGEGRLVLEWAKGRHADMEKKGLGEIKKAEFNNNANPGQIHLEYEGEATTEEKNIALGALKYFTPEIKREALENLNIYAEWSYSKENGYWFFEATSEKDKDKKFWTNLERKRDETKPNEYGGD